MKIALVGYGKMGKAIEQVALSRQHEIVLKITSSNPEEFTPGRLSDADIAIEFTQPHSAFQNIMKIFDAGIPVVCGTTGWNDRLEEAKKICEEKGRSFFHASNFSPGVNIFFELNTRMAAMVDRFEQFGRITVSETHHTAKKDAPSGTAITLAEEILSQVKRFDKWKNFDREKAMEDADLSDTRLLPILSIRTGDVAGIHEVSYESDDDLIRLSHHAKSRIGFARGAVMAAEWLRGRKGVFGMKEMLGL